MERWKNTQTDEKTKRRTNGYTNGWTEGHTDGRKHAAHLFVNGRKKKLSVDAGNDLWIETRKNQETDINFTSLTDGKIYRQFVHVLDEQMDNSSMPTFV